MGKEVSIQQKIIKYLKSKGCYVVKTHPGLGTPTGCPDILFFKEGFYGAIECKSSRTSAWQPLQKETIMKFHEWSWGRALYPENYQDVVDELDGIL